MDANLGQRTVAPPTNCHPERSVIVRRTVTRSRGTQRLPAPATNWQGVLSARCGCGQQLSPNPIAQGGRSRPPPLRLQRTFQATPLICHPERSVIVRRTLTRSRGTPRLPAPATNPQGVLSARCGCGQQLSPNPIAQGEHSCPPPSRLLWIFQAIPKSVIPSAA